MVGNTVRRVRARSCSTAPVLIANCGADDREVPSCIRGAQIEAIQRLALPLGTDMKRRTVDLPAVAESAALRCARWRKVRATLQVLMCPVMLWAVVIAR
jgi:hypothetical protein